MAAMILTYNDCEAKIIALRQQLADSHRREVMLRDALEHHQAQTRPIQKTIEALASTADLDGLILCDAMPITWYDPMAKQFQLGTEPLYRAWEPKP
jgi:hypothetical protein